jgi:predicted small lipoprotein YifL
MRNTIRTLAAVMILGVAAGCGPDQGTTRDPAIDGTTPGTAPGMMPGDTMHMDTVPRTGAPGAPGTTGG